MKNIRQFQVVQNTDVDPYTGDLFSNFTDVGTDCQYSRLVYLAKEFIDAVEVNFMGISINHSPEDYAQWYIDNNRMDWE